MESSQHCNVDKTMNNKGISFLSPKRSREQLLVNLVLVPDRQTVVEQTDCLSSCQTGTLCYTCTHSLCLLVFPVNDHAVTMLDSEQLLFPPFPRTLWALKLVKKINDMRQSHASSSDFVCVILVPLESTFCVLYYIWKNKKTSSVLFNSISASSNLPKNENAKMMYLLWK